MTTLTLARPARPAATPATRTPRTARTARTTPGTPSAGLAPTTAATPAAPTASAAAGPTDPTDPTPQAPTRRLTHDWVGDAACDGTDPALFDPVNRHVAARATAVCAACPVQRACLLDALDDEEDTAYGPWLVRGGMTPKERRDLRGPARRALVDDLRASLTPTAVR